MNTTIALLLGLALTTVGCSSADEGDGASAPGPSERPKPTACVYKNHHRKACTPDYPRSFNEDYVETKCLDTSACRLSEPRSRTVGGCVTVNEEFDGQIVEDTCEHLGLGHVCEPAEQYERYLGRWECAETACAEPLKACNGVSSCLARVLCMEDCSRPALGHSLDTCRQRCADQPDEGPETEEAVNGVATCLADSSCKPLCGRIDYGL